MRPLLRAQAAQGWEAHTCEIVSTAVKEYSDDDGPTYDVVIEYSYSVRGVSYRSRRYDFSGLVASTGRSAKQAIVDAHPVGSRAPCWADPREPDQAVIDRDIPPGVWGTGLLAIFFFALGGVGAAAFVSRDGRRVAE